MIESVNSRRFAEDVLAPMKNDGNQLIIKTDKLLIQYVSMGQSCMKKMVQRNGREFLTD